jgi:hypothetical protein
MQHPDPRHYRWQIVVTIGLILSTLVALHPAASPYATLAGMAVNLFWLWE